MPPPERPYPLPDTQTLRLSEQVQAQEDEAIFRQLDSIATGSPRLPLEVVRSRFVGRIPADPPYVQEYIPGRAMVDLALHAFSWVPHPVQPQARMYMSQQDWDDIAGPGVAAARAQQEATFRTAVARILAAVKLKTPEPVPEPKRESRQPMTVWEALLELELVDDEP